MKSCFIVFCVLTGLFWAYYDTGGTGRGVTAPVVDLGQVATGSRTRFEVALDNRTKETWVVAGVKAGCSCAAVEVVPEEVPPGSAAIVHGVYTAGFAPGSAEKNVIVRLASGKDLVVKLIATVKLEVSFLPSELLLHPELSTGLIDSSLIRIANDSAESIDATVSISVLSGARGSLSVIPDSLSIAAGASCNVSVSADGDFVSPACGEVRILTTHPSQRVLRIPVNVQPLGGISVVPAAFHFGVIRKADLLRRPPVKISLSGEMVGMLDVSVCSCPEYLKHCKTTRGPDGQIELEFMFADSFSTSSLSADVLVTLTGIEAEYTACCRVGGYLLD